MIRLLAVLALMAFIPLATPAVAVAAPKSDQGDVSNTKKPGETCEKYKRGSDAYKDCIQKQAHTDQTGKGKGHDKDQDKGKGAGASGDKGKGKGTGTDSAGDKGKGKGTDTSGDKGTGKGN